MPTAVIVNWETPQYTIRAARALLEDGLSPEQLVIVDNGSKDGSYETFVRELPGCLTVRIEENIGYARAANLGAASRPAASYLFLNNDAFVHRQGSVGLLVKALEWSSVGIVAPRVLNEDLTLQPTVTALQTPAVALVRASGISRFIPNRWQPSWSTHWDHASSRAIQAAASAVMLVRGVTWEELKGFDEQLYFYADDLDLCLRAGKAGWEVWFSSEAEFVHIGSGSTANRWSSASRCERVGRSEASMIRKNLSPTAAKLSLAFITAGLLARSAVYRLVGQRAASDALRATVRGLLERSLT
jgi:GT2 family glycosyltransferase